jgi:intracellular septation protein A
MAANATAMCTSFKLDLLNGVHAFSAAFRAADVFKAALYLANTGIGAATPAYTATGEVSSSGTNYTAAGMAVTFGTAPLSSGTSAFVTPSAAIVYTNVTLTASFDCVLLYNSSATGKNAVASFLFGAQTITAGTLTLTMPVNAAGTALLQIN